MDDYISLEDAKGLVFKKVEAVNEESIKIHWENGQYSEIKVGTTGYEGNVDYFLNY